MPRIEAKVAEVLNDREVVLNKGEEDGVSAGMRFAILRRDRYQITDPETGRSLGPIDLPKTVVKVVRVYPEMAVARTFRRIRANQGLFGFLSSDVPEQLRTDELTLESKYGESEPVRNGDHAVQTTGDEYEDS